MASVNGWTLPDNSIEGLGQRNPEIDQLADFARTAATIINTDGTIDASAASFDFPDLANHIIYVDGGRTDTYTETGSILEPYKTLAAAIAAINTDVAVHVAANTYDKAQYRIIMTPGTYSGAVALGNVKYLAIEMNGAVISGNITYDTTMVGGSADYYYSRLEFVGCRGNRAEKGMAGRITGSFTATRNNDSLSYVSFSGVDVTGNIKFTTDGTWVVWIENCKIAGYFEGSSFTSPGSCVLLETGGFTEFTGKIANSADDSATNVSLYGVDRTTFGVINITPTYGGKVTNCTFGDAITITAMTFGLDAVSYKSFMQQTPTTAGATISKIEGSLSYYDASALTTPLVMTGTSNTLSIAGLANLNGGIAVDTNKFTVSAAGAIAGASISIAGDISTIAYVSFSPTLAVSGGTAPAYTTTECYYVKVGKLVYAWYSFSGDGGAEGNGTNAILFTLPVAAAASMFGTNNKSIGSGSYYNGGIGYRMLDILCADANNCKGLDPVGNDLFIGNMQNNTSRQVEFHVVYQAA